MADLNIESVSVKTEMPFELVKAYTESCVVYDNESCILHVDVGASDGDSIEVNVVCNFVYNPDDGDENKINVSMDGKNMTVNVLMTNWNNDYYTISNRIKIFSYCGSAVYIEFIVNSINVMNDSNFSEMKKRFIIFNVYTQPVEMEKLMKEYEDNKRALAAAKALEEKTAEQFEKLKENQSNGFGLGALAGMMGGMMGGMDPEAMKDIIEGQAKEVDDESKALPAPEGSAEPDNAESSPEEPKEKA